MSVIMGIPRYSVSINSLIIIIIIIIIIITRNYKKYILKQPNTDELCRRCGKEQ